MKKVLLLALIIAQIYFASSLNATISCPSSVNFQEEFECKISVDDAETYDLKLDILGNNERIAQIYDVAWKSTYYYLLGFINNEEKTVKLKIIKEFNGNASYSLKLRKDNVVKYSKDSFIFVNNVNNEENNIEEEIEVINEVNNKTEKENPIINKQETKPEVIVNDKPNTQEILILNSPEEVIYKSKSALIQEYAIYGFCIFLIFIIIVLIIKM